MGGGVGNNASQTFGSPEFGPRVLGEGRLDNCLCLKGKRRCAFVESKGGGGLRGCVSMSGRGQVVDM